MRKIMVELFGGAPTTDAFGDFNRRLGNDVRRERSRHQRGTGRIGLPSVAAGATSRRWHVQRRSIYMFHGGEKWREWWAWRSGGRLNSCSGIGRVSERFAVQSGLHAGKVSFAPCVNPNQCFGKIERPNPFASGAHNITAVFPRGSLQRESEIFLTSFNKFSLSGTEYLTPDNITLTGILIQLPDFHAFRNEVFIRSDVVGSQCLLGSRTLVPQNK